MKISIDENIGDEVRLDFGTQGKILSIHISGPQESITYEIGWWYECIYKIDTFWRFEFELTSSDDEKKIEAGII